MHYGKQRRRRAGYFTVLLFTILGFFSCQKGLSDLPTEEDFTREKMEKLGSLLLDDLASQYTFLPDLPPYDTTVYWYVQTLYNQAAGTMHLDKQSAPDNRWDPNRQWQVFIIKNDAARHAFTLPGGNLFITTGMLLSFENEYELYYLLTFEATLMHEGHLLKRLIREYNSLTLDNIIGGNAPANQITEAIIAEELPNLVYETSTIKEADKQAVESVCKTSIFDPTGIIPFLENPAFENALWLKTRTSYGGRASILEGLAMPPCGTLTGNGNYQWYVLNRLK